MAKLLFSPGRVVYIFEGCVLCSVPPHCMDPDAYHQLSRPEQVAIVRRASGHNRLNAHMYRKNKLVPSPLCPCGEEEEKFNNEIQNSTGIDLKPSPTK